jgi:hypothetical protein
MTKCNRAIISWRTWLQRLTENAFKADIFFSKTVADVNTSVNKNIGCLRVYRSPKTGRWRRIYILAHQVEQ